MKLKFIFLAFLLIVVGAGTTFAQQRWVQKRNSRPDWATNRNLNVPEEEPEPAGTKKSKKDAANFGNRNTAKTPLVLIPDSNCFIGKYEVTQGRYEMLMGKNPSFNKSRGKTRPNHPVENVTRQEALEYCVKLTEYEREQGWLPDGYEYTLPTRQEWLDSYYCKKQAKFNLKDYTSIAWFFETAAGETHEIGKKIHNEIKTNDMAGNVAELTLNGDILGGSFGDEGHTGPSHPKYCNCDRKVLRTIDGKVSELIVPRRSVSSGSSFSKVRVHGGTTTRVSVGGGSSSEPCRPRKIEDISVRERAPSKYVGFRVCLTNKKENFASKHLKK